MTTATHQVAVPGEEPVEVTVTDVGAGQPFLLLHGGAGPQSVQPFGEQFAAVNGVRVLVPIRRGLPPGRPRPRRRLLRRPDHRPERAGAVGHGRMRAAWEARRERLPRDHGHLAMMDASMAYLRQFVPEVLAAVRFGARATAERPVAIAS